MPFEYFEEESHVSTYNKFRPSPPKSLIEKVIDFTREKISEPLELAVDVGCGSGQTTELLAPYFKRVLGFDLNDQIVREARKKCQNLNVFYSACPGEKLDLENGVADLVTVSQAIHWFDIPKFYSEADRILKSKGVLAIFGYCLPVIEGSAEMEKLIEKYHEVVLKDYCLPQGKKSYVEKYTAKEFNDIYFIDGPMQRVENLMLETVGTLNDITGHISTWSAFQNYTKERGKENGKKLLENFQKEYKLLLNDDAQDTCKVKFNYFLLLGRKK